MEECPYLFRAEDTTAAHTWCALEAARWLFQGVPVIVSNTFVHQWEIANLELLTRHRVEERWIAQGAYTNIHGVPDMVIEKMCAEWEVHPADKPVPADSASDYLDPEDA